MAGLFYGIIPDTIGKEVYNKHQGRGSAWTLTGTTVEVDEDEGSPCHNGANRPKTGKIDRSAEAFRASQARTSFPPG
jgi:hypothetical protein